MRNSLIDILNDSYAKYVKYDNKTVTRFLISKELDNIVNPMISFFESNDSYGIFNETFQQFGYGATITTYRRLAIWLLSTAELYGTDNAVHYLQKYIENASFKAYKVIWLNGIRLDQDWNLSSNITLIRIENFPIESIKRKLYSQTDIFDWTKPTAVLVEEIVHKKLHFHQDEKRIYDKSILNIENLDIYRLLFSLVRQNEIAVQSLGSSLVIPDNIPNFGGLSFSINNYNFPPMGAQIINIEVTSLKKLYGKFLLLKKSEQKRLKSILIKLNQFLSARDPVDQSIIIRVILEMLFLDINNQGELSFNLSLRIAKYYGKDYEEKKTIQSKIKKIYNISSKAIHNGDLSIKDKEKTKTLYKEASIWIKTMICDMIDGRKIDWKKILLD